LGLRPRCEGGYRAAPVLTRAPAPSENVGSIFLRPKQARWLVLAEMQTEVIELTHLARPKRDQFGEFLVKHAVLDRFQLFRALQLQDRLPGTLLGTCAVALGFAARERIEQLYARFLDRDGELDTMTTDAFHREPDIEVIWPF
jgi:hypothetical protein